MYLFALLAVLSQDAPTVRTLRTPDSGIQPQIALGPSGTRHLLYYKGDPKAGDLYYSSCSKDPAAFEPGIRVNSIPGAACAVGTMRGGQIAISPDGRIHIAWNGSHAAAKHFKDANPGAVRHAGEPMLYTRSDADRKTFGPERDVMTRTRDLDGGGSIAIGSDGRIAIVWHASTLETESKGEPGRQVFIATSTDRGTTFQTEAPFAWPADPLGACGCCGLKASFAPDGSLMVLFRSAAEKSQRDMHLLRTTDLGRTCTDTLLGQWRVSACPMSSAAATGNLIAWESERNIFWSALGSETKPISPAKSDATRKFPALASNARGEVLLAWVEGAGFGTEGTLAWQVFESGGAPIEGAAGRGGVVPKWSLVAAFAESDGSFTILY